MSNQKAITKTLKFIIITDKKQSDILNKITARRTYAIRKYLELIEKEEELIQPQRKYFESRLRELTIKTKNRPNVPFDFKELTGLNTSDLMCCSYTAVEIWRTYRATFDKWEKRYEKASIATILTIHSNIDFETNGQIINFSSSIEDVITTFSETRFKHRIMKSKPSPPLQSHKYQPKKIPTKLKFPGNLIAYRKNKIANFCKIRNSKLFIKISTLVKGQPLELELGYYKDQLKELKERKFKSGIIFKNTQKKRWEFHAYIQKEPLKHTNNENPKAILGIDLGQVIDATVVVLVEGEKVSQERIHFFKEGDLRRRKFNLQQRIRVLQRIRDEQSGEAKKKAVTELKILSGKIKSLTLEACHRISRKIALVANELVCQGYNVYVSIGKLKGLRYRARRGNGRSTKFRGRIHSFPYYLLTKYITYKCREVGVESVCEINESWTSKTCHLCNSTLTKRPSQASFECLACGLKYNADLNGAINIAKRFWVKHACSNCQSLNTYFTKLGEVHCSDCQTTIPISKNGRKNSELVMMIFLSRKSEGKSKSYKTSAEPQGIDDSPSCDESTGTNVHLKVEEVRKRYIDA
ncbi:MAG: transposase [Candidatus Heimdallarchaeota archaeon]